jgi:threonine dehydrogenase-like Zn-dependent dehydrogenase
MGGHIVEFAMKTVKAFGPGDLRIVEVPDPVPAEGEVLVAVRTCGICGSDKWFWSVTGPTDYVAGHEAAGDVVALGPGVSRLRAGDRVAVNNVRGCGLCQECRDGRFVWCLKPIRHMGYGFSELIAVPERNCLSLDSGLGYEAGSLIFDVWGTPFTALDRAGIAAGQTVMICGCGPIGLAAVYLAKSRGARVIGVDPLAYRREAALELGAAGTLIPAQKRKPPSAR